MNLQGKRVAFAGRLAGLTRLEAAKLVRDRGGEFVARVSRTTSVLIVGQDGLPLQKDGQLSDKLRAARSLQAAGQDLAILAEDDFLRELAREGVESTHQRFTLTQLVRLLKVPRNRLRSWIRSGWLQPATMIAGVAYFDFQQVAGIQSLWRLIRSGVSRDRLRRSLEQLSHWLPIEPSSLLEIGGQLLVRLEQGQLVDSAGQMHFDFASEASAAIPVASASELFVRGCRLEESGELEEAATVYRRALEVEPQARVHYNLGNVLYASGAVSQAAEHYRRALDIEPGDAEAWNNLGGALAESGEIADAIKAFRQAIDLRLDYADPHFNLADLLEETDRSAEARRHWQSYLRMEPIGEHANYARSRLQKTG